jgi:glucosamine-6-phosphate deaminase
MQVRTFPDRAALGRAAGSEAAEVLRTSLARKGAARIILAAAPSQTETLDTLVSAPGIAWDRVTAFHMDDYIGLNPNAPERFASWLAARVFDRLPLGQVHRLTPDPDPAEAARRYAATLAEAPIDLVILGIGENGHLAFNDPPVARFEDPEDVKVVDLDAACRQQQVNDGCFARLDDVPRQALTLTIPRLLRADRLICVVPGRSKRGAVAAALHGPLSTDCPASILREQAHCSLYLDPDSDPDA